MIRVDDITSAIIMALEEIENGKSIRHSLRNAIGCYSCPKKNETEIYQTVFDIYRRLNAIDLYIKKGTPNISFKKVETYKKARIRLLTYWLKFKQYSIQKITKKIHSDFYSEKKFLLKVIENISGISEKTLYDHCWDPETKISLDLAIPTWMVRKFIFQWGATFTKNLLQSFNQRLPIYIRINTLLSSQKEILDSFLLSNTEYLVDEHIKNLIKITNSPKPIPLYREFEEGKIILQQKSSVLAVEVLNPHSTEKIIDMCASPGGKTSHIASMMEKRGELIAIDIDQERIMLLKDRLKRLGADYVRCIKADSRALCGVYGEYFDKVLLDPPCTGSGTFASRPELKWSIKRRDLVWYSNLQKELLEEAGRIVKSGGYVVYSTCSLFEDENQAVITSFLDRNKEFEVIDAVPIIGKSVDIDGHKCQYLFPHSDKTEGFFIAKLKKCEN